jgi:hypothetical protein
MLYFPVPLRPVMGIFATVALPMISAVSSLGGVFLWAWLSNRHEQRRRTRDFIEKQVRELYSPLLNIRQQVRALSELRERAAAESVWKELYREARERGGGEALRQLSVERSTGLQAIVHDKNDQWKKELLPCYKAMLQIFQEKIWLAEETTRERFQKLTVYVELWERGLNRAIPVEVVAWLNVREADLVPLYEDLEHTFRKLRAKLT